MEAQYNVKILKLGHRLNSVSCELERATTESCCSCTCLSALLLASSVFAPLPMTRQLPMGVEDAETPSRA